MTELNVVFGGRKVNVMELTREELTDVVETRERVVGERYELVRWSLGDRTEYVVRVIETIEEGVEIYWSVLIGDVTEEEALAIFNVEHFDMVVYDRVFFGVAGFVYAFDSEGHEYELAH